MTQNAFKVDTRLALLLSENYRSPEKALKTLVDNVWDAEVVDIYLGQVGVAEAYIGDVYNRIEKYTRENVLPYVDDFGAQLEWYDSFKNPPKIGLAKGRSVLIVNTGLYNDK